MEVKNLKLVPSREYENFRASPVAFFCAEYAFNDDFAFAGGLGILASDFILQASENGLPLVAIGLWYGGPKNQAGEEYSLLLDNGKPFTVDIPCAGKVIKTNVWTRYFGKSAVLCLLDTNNQENSPENQAITNRLYDSNLNYRLEQEIVLGIGGVRLLENLGIKPKVYHLNEGHTAFAAFELLARSLKENKTTDLSEALDNVKKKIVATKHTIFSIAGEVITKNQLTTLFGPYLADLKLSVDDIFKLGENKNDPTTFSTTQFLLNCAGKQNGVSKLHTVAEKIPHPSSILFPITNGIYEKRWQADFWRIADQGSEIPDKTAWEVRQKLRERLVHFVKEKTEALLDPEACTIVWARRFTAYKRPELLFSDLERLKRICSGPNKVQFIISGKAHILDVEGLRSVETIKALANDSAFKNKIVYIEDYSVAVAMELVSGADVWLNTPKRGFEACGTSGMKAGLNGAVQASVSDGWIDEVDWSGIGFILPVENTDKALYDVLENEIIPIFYKKNDADLPLDWIKRVRLTRNIIKSNFTAKRMLNDYLTKAYIL
ncbi:MAG: alpha-glucan family phosphorylase [Minisyncoccia bacterium]